MGGHIAIAAISILLSIVLIPSESIQRDGPDFHVGFYNQTCPKVEQIVAEHVRTAFYFNPGIAAGLIRLFFHDCFVNGCDASILLDSTPTGKPVEKESPANGKTLRGLELIDEIKERLEYECPGIVSCADILAFTTRDAVVLSGLPYHLFPAGRRDGLISWASDIINNLPGAMVPIKAIADIFTRKGLTVEEMVVLTSAHSIGIAHCSSFDYRLYSFSNTEPQDPKLQQIYASYLSVQCPSPKSWQSAIFPADRKVNFNPSSPFRLDNSFYIRLLQQKALLQSDQALAVDPLTSGIVHTMAADRELWSRKFIEAMTQLSRVDVLTGNAGEIRRTCRAINNRHIST